MTLERPTCNLAGMVAEKHKMDSGKAAALGMLSPKVGIAALGSVLGGLSGSHPTPAVVGAAAAVYWHKLLANVKPLPPMFAEVMATAEHPKPTRQEVCIVVGCPSTRAHPAL